MKYGTPQQIKRWGTIMWSGAGNWTQLFSEPADGSENPWKNLISPESSPGR